MPYPTSVPPETFEAIQNVDIDKLSELPDLTLRPILPCLVRMSLCAPLDTSQRWTEERKKILKCLSGVEVVNSLVALLSIDFHELEQDARKEQQLRSKIGGAKQESVLISQLQQSVALEFERSESAGKLRLLLSELLFVMSQMKDSKQEFYEKSSELFESEVYLEEVSDVLCIAQAELPSLLPVRDVAETLLHVPNGAWLLCRLLANVPDSFGEVCRSLVMNGEKQDEESVAGQRRAEALRLLCEMCPTQALTVRALCIEHCRLPSLAVALTLHHCQSSQSDDSYIQTSESGEGLSDVVGFVSGLLLGSDSEIRNWFATFIKTGQKRKDSNSMLHSLRQELLEQLMMVLHDRTTDFADTFVVHGCAFIRLYCALKCIASLRFNEEEIQVLLRLVTCRPRPSASGVRFICLALCMLLACPYMLGSSEQEKQAIDWIKWLVRESANYERLSGVRASFGEMLLLIAILFHGNQNTAIADLVSTTLGMKSAVKANSLARMKILFTQDIFTEQVVTGHAVKVSVTTGLSADISGYLPVHCIYQLLKSRAFSKHQVPIKDWIFRQLCKCTTPMHPLLPPLLDAYIHSIILPSNKTDRTNEPITEQEILSVFKDSILTRHLGKTPSATGARAKHDSSHGDIEPMEVDGESQAEHKERDERSKFMTQLLLVYYILLYQDTLLNNMKTIVSSSRSVPSYSPQLLAQLPVRALLQQAQRRQHLYAGLFSPLLRLLATHFPHLCLVEDWLEENQDHTVSLGASAPALPRLPCTAHNLAEAYDKLQSCPSLLLLQLEQLTSKSPSDLLAFTDVIIGSLPRLLVPGVPRKVLEETRHVWIKLNTIIPRKLRVLTVNALQPREGLVLKPVEYSESELTLDPLLVLRCDGRVFRCPPLLSLLLRILEAFLQASRSQLSEHIQAHPVHDKAGQTQLSQEREELKVALLTAQESAAVQVLLECCLPEQHESKAGSSMLSELREVQCLVCSRLHQMFIADPALAKLVHFQGYPSQLLPITVAGIPSMHICLDFIPELISQPHHEKQLFAVELVSHLSLQYALPKSLSVARLAVNVLTTLLTVLPCESRPDFFLCALPAVGRISRAFPPLSDDIVHLLTQLGRICHSHLSTVTNSCEFLEDYKKGELSLDIPPRSPAETLSHECADRHRDVSVLDKYRRLNTCIQQTFSHIVCSTAMMKNQVH